jgi:hypothetical protein
VRSAKRVLNELPLPRADAIRADARRFHQLVVWPSVDHPQCRVQHGYAEAHLHQ